MSSKECTVCLERKPVSEFTAMTSSCSHNISCCRSCSTKYITSQLNTKGLVKICCIDSNCSCILDHSDLQKFLTKENLDRWCTLSTRKYLATLPDFRWCSNPACTNGQIIEEATEDCAWICTACHFEICFLHQVPMHPGKCSEYRYRSEEVASIDWFQRFTKRCPNCQAAIEKDGGCDHMVCRVDQGGCGFEFCWQCLADYADIRKYGKSHHKPSCQHRH